MKNTIAEELKSKYWQIDKVENFRELVYRSAEKFPKRNAFRLKDENGKIYGVTYEKFKNDVEALGTIMLEMGLEDQKIAVIGKNSYNWAISYLASSIIGVVVPIDKELPVTDVTNFINVSNSAAVFGDSKYIKNILDNKEQVNSENVKYVKMDNKEKVDNVANFNNIIKDGEVLLTQNNTKFRDLEIDPEKLHILLFTSGTTGKAKGVELSQKNILTNIRSVYGIFKVKPSDQVLSILPIHHTYECSLGFLLLMYAGACVSYCEGLKYITKNIQEFRPTVILCVPLLLENIHKKIEKTIEKLAKKFNKKDMSNYTLKDLPFFARFLVKIGVKKSLGGRMRAFIIGAAPLNPDIVNEFYKLGVRAVQGYGLTECSPLVAGNTDFYYKADAVGLPIPGVEYKVSNPDDQGIGEIIVKGDNVMLGYYNDKEETNKVIKDGWFYTGDLGRIDEDGFLYITGRCKTVIVTKNGKNIYPEEIEDHLMQRDEVKECIVLGVNYENDDETYVHAKIYPDMEYLQEQNNKQEFSEDEIRDIMSKVVSEVNKKLPNYKHIKKFYITDKEFEKTTTQKIKRFGDNLII